MGLKDNDQVEQLDDSDSNASCPLLFKEKKQFNPYNNSAEIHSDIASDASLDMEQSGSAVSPQLHDEQDGPNDLSIVPDYDPQQLSIVPNIAPEQLSIVPNNAPQQLSIAPNNAPQRGRRDEDGIVKLRKDVTTIQRHHSYLKQQESFFKAAEGVRYKDQGALKQAEGAG